MITPLFVLFSKTILTQEVTMDFYFLINCSTSLYNRPDNPKAQSDYNYMKENLRLRKELEEAQKEVLFLKKAAAFFAKEID